MSFFLREKAQVVTGHTPHAPCVCVPFSCLCPRRTGFISRFGRAPFVLAFCRGAILGPGRFGDFWILSVLGGLEITRPLLRPCFLDARRQGCLLSILLLSCVVFSPSVVFCGCFTPTRRGGPVLERGIPRVIAPAPRPSEGSGSAIVRGRLDTAFRDIFFASLCLAEGHRDPRDHFWRGGGVYCPLGSLFHTHVCFPLPQVFLFFFSLSLSLSRSLCLSVSLSLVFFAGPWGPELATMTFRECTGPLRELREIDPGSPRNFVYSAPGAVFPRNFVHDASRDAANPRNFVRNALKGAVIPRILVQDAPRSAIIPRFCCTIRSKML